MENENNTRPFDVLSSSIGKEVIVYLKYRDVFNSISGILMSYDMHVNICLVKAIFHPNDKSCENISIGKSFIRGDNILLISPAK